MAWRAGLIALALMPVWGLPAVPAAAASAAGLAAAVNGQAVAVAGAEEVRGIACVPVRDACRALGCSVEYRAGLVTVTAGEERAGRAGWSST